MNVALTEDNVFWIFVSREKIKGARFLTMPKGYSFTALLILAYILR